MIRLIAKLDVKPPYVVKPIHFEGLKKVGKPDELSQKYFMSGIDEIMYIDIVASLYDREILTSFIKHSAQNIFIPFGVGGGIKSIEDAKKIFDNGADKVILNTHALQHDPSIINNLSNTFGSQAVVVNIEAKRLEGHYECYSDGGRNRSYKSVANWVEEVYQRGAGEILIQSVDKDGKRNGFDIDLVSNVVNAVPIPVVVASGFGDIQHVKQLLAACTPSAIAISTALHYDNLNLNDIKKEIQSHG